MQVVTISHHARGTIRPARPFAVDSNANESVAPNRGCPNLKLRFGFAKKEKKKKKNMEQKRRSRRNEQLLHVHVHCIGVLVLEESRLMRCIAYEKANKK